MPLLSIICFLICLGIVVSAMRRDADTLSPARVFGFIWALAFGLTELKLSGLQHTWTTDSWIQLLIGVFSFLLGIMIGYVLNIGRPLLSLTTIRRTWTKDIDERRLFISIAVMFALYVLAYVVITFGKGVKPPLFSPKPWIARREFTMFGIGLFLHHVVVVAYFTVIYFLTAEAKKLRKYLTVAMTAICLVTYFFLLQRLQIMMVALLCAALIYYTTFHLRKSTVVAYLIGASLFFLLVSTLRAGQLFILYLYTESHMLFSPSYAIFTEPYMYVVMNLENFTRSVDRLDAFTYGYYTFDFTTALVGIKHWISDYFGLIDTPYLISSYNTYTSFWTFYRDFGIVGIGVIPGLLGWGISTAYYWMRRNPNLRSITIYSVAVFVMFISFFNSPLGFLWFVYNMLTVYIILRVIRVHPNPGLVASPGLVPYGA